MKESLHQGGAARQLAPCPQWPNCVSSRATKAWQRVEPLQFEGPAAEAMQRLRAAVESFFNARIVEFSPTYLRAELTSRLFRFVDDLELLLDEEERVIHVRSASRLGVWDLGVNRRRVSALRRIYRRQWPASRSR